jgi:hypothetical protein
MPRVVHCGKSPSTGSADGDIGSFGLAPQLSFVTFPPNSGPLPIWGGTELRPGEIVLYGRGERMHQSTPGSFVWNVIALNRLRLEQ